MNNVFFNLDGLDEFMNESSEFETKEDIKIDEVEIPVPGGDKEEPNVKYDEEDISVPGGDTEKPTAKEFKEEDIPVPGGDKEEPNVNLATNHATLTEDDYNDALDNLQKSFKESAVLFDLLRNSKVIPKSVEDRQNDYVESALYESFMDGPLYEAVDRSDKAVVKEINKKISSKVANILKDENIFFGSAKRVFGAIPFNGVISASTLSMLWKNRLWQILGVMHLESGNVSTVISKLNEEFKDELGEYKILASKSLPSFTDLLATKFGWKNTKSVYTLLIDKKLPSEFKKAEAEIKQNDKKGKE